MRRACSLLLLLLALASARAEAPKRDHDITVDDYFSLATIFDCALSPDGKLVAYTEGRWQRSTDDRKTDLWVADASEPGSLRRLTADRANDRSPRWAPDGKTVYFLGNRKRDGEKHPPYDGTTQVWKFNLGTGLAPVTRIEGGVSLYDLSKDGKAIWYAVDVEHRTPEWKALREKFKDIDYGHGVEKVSQAWRLDLVSWRAEKLVDAKRYVRDLVVHGDERAAMITTPDDRVISFEGRSRVDVFDRATGKIETVPDEVFRRKAASPYGWLEHLAWSPDGSKLAFNVIFDAYPAEIIIASFGKEVEVVKAERPEGLSVKGYGSPLVWANDSWLSFLGEQKACVFLCNIAATRNQGTFEARAFMRKHGEGVVQTFSSNGKQTAVLMNTPSAFEEIYLESEGARTRLTNANPQTARWKLPKLSIVSWKGAKGDEVQGILEVPADHREGDKLPLVVCIHGGPTTADHFGLQFWIYGRTMLPAKGYAVLCPNYRGSTGYGDRFLTDLVGHENDYDVEDILKGVDALVEKGIADPERLGVMGWSNGGYLTNCIITKTTRFKAASSGAGIVDAIMEWGGNDEPAYQMAFQGGFPWNRAAVYHKASATYQLDKARTPTLIHVGANDERCPPSQSRMLYRALKEYNKVATELLVYPGESHGVMKYKHRQAKMEWDLAWFERHILGKKGE